MNHLTTRRYCLVAALGLLLIGQAMIAQEPQAPAAVLTTKRMCCSKESGPAIKEMSNIPGVEKVVANHKAQPFDYRKGKCDDFC